MARNSEYLSSHFGLFLQVPPSHTKEVLGSLQSRNPLKGTPEVPWKGPYGPRWMGCITCLGLLLRCVYWGEHEMFYSISPNWQHFKERAQPSTLTDRGVCTTHQCSSGLARSLRAQKIPQTHGSHQRQLHPPRLGLSPEVLACGRFPRLQPARFTPPHALISHHPNPRSGGRRQPQRVIHVWVECVLQVKRYGQNSPVPKVNPTWYLRWLEGGQLRYHRGE